MPRWASSYIIRPVRQAGPKAVAGGRQGKPPSHYAWDPGPSHTPMGAWFKVS